MKRRIYADSSVIGGCEDTEFAEFSVRLMDGFTQGESILVLSDLTLQALSFAPESVRRHLAAVPESSIEILELSHDADELAQAYLEAGVLPVKMRVDAQHIAIATVGRVDVLVSWNFKHMVNLKRIQGYNAVNLRTGYPMIEIRTRREVLPDE